MVQLVSNSENYAINQSALAPTATPLAARLLIHADETYRARESQRNSKLWWLRRLYSKAQGRENQAPLCLQIADLQGKQVMVIDDAEPLTDVSLPAGAYQVTAHSGKVRRGYTLKLASGTSFDLYLRLVPGQS